MFSSSSPNRPASSPTCSSQDRPSCQVAEQELQNCLSQAGQVTATPWYLLPSQMLQIVRHPDEGHQVRVVSRDTSVEHMSLEEGQPLLALPVFKREDLWLSISSLSVRASICFWLRTPCTRYVIQVTGYIPHHRWTGRIRAGNIVQPGHYF